MAPRRFEITVRRVSGATKYRGWARLTNLWEDVDPSHPSWFIWDAVCLVAWPYVAVQYIFLVVPCFETVSFVKW